MTDAMWRSPPPEVCGAKVQRSAQLLEQTRLAIHRWFAEVGERDAVIERQDQPGSWLVRVPDFPAPLMEFGILVSDAVHNLRTALDHLASWTVERNGGSVTRDTAFPVVIEPEKWPKEARTKLAGASGPDVETIERFQPFRLEPRSHWGEPGVSLVKPLPDSAFPVGTGVDPLDLSVLAPEDQDYIRGLYERLRQQRGE